MVVKLVFLHGVGQTSGDVSWRAALDATLDDLGYPTTSRVELVAPDYLSLLTADSVPFEPTPDRTSPAAVHRARRSEFERQQASMRRLLGIEQVQDQIKGVPERIPDWLIGPGVEGGTRLGPLTQARRYMADEGRRNAIVRRVLNALPAKGEIVLIGHSLGSLVAIDVLDHLPVDVTVRRLVTIGSPAGMGAVHKGSERLLKEFPYAQVKSWLNVLAPYDAVTGGRGLAGTFPAAQDLRIDLPLPAHGAQLYLGNERVALAVGEALFGSLSRDLDRPVTSVDVRPTDTESLAIFSLAYAHMTLADLMNDDAERGERYAGALAVVQQEVAATLQSVAKEDGRTPGPAVLDLSSDAAPACPRIWEVDQVIRVLVTAATTNLVAPWEIDTQSSAMRALDAAGVGLGFSSQHGGAVRNAIIAARKGLALDNGQNWKRILLGAAGIGLVVAGPLGLVLAAPAGLAGAAAITAALAGFGPGGMVGGMTLAGAMISAGAVTTTASLIAHASKQAVEIQVLRHVAHADARKRLGIEQDPTDWQMVVMLESEIARELDRLSAFSDPKTPAIVELQGKKKVVRRAITWMLDRGLGLPALAEGETSTPEPEDRPNRRTIPARRGRSIARKGDN